ncbi:radical SAM protein [Paenibacillus dendritiformis]|uniref:radical SAM/SPASM domain-containing protein n=1 Tax=Paenibacillus dendritiformis TaxID=130049 RepID=UPI00143D12E6|nr:radical SAM protein [Paenibacillus dendritiformis]NKI20630.1 radical SAM protein [Paenibacillus dendritiformis]NRF96515.1 radical SAM protein [Paenibacillus dendritiformis]
MKNSYYNFFFDFPEHTKKLAYNARSGSLALMDVDKYNSYHDFVESGKTIDDENLVRDLQKGGFLIDDNLNELDIMRHELFTHRYSSNHLGITIAPTLQCNLRCIYCYEKENLKNSYMSEETQQELVALVEKQAKYLDSLNVTWYGGEPLLAFDIIVSMTEKFLDICKRFNIQYSAGIITNGFKLSRDLAAKFGKLQISFVQITLDGSRETHNTRRPLRGGQPTYDKILSNIIEVADLVNISIRINTDVHNKTSLEQLLLDIEKNNLKEKVSLYLGHVQANNDCYETNSCMTRTEFSKYSYLFDKEAHSNGFNTKHYRVPYRITNFCTADRKNSLVVDPDGLLYNCWVDIGDKEKAFGSISDSQIGKANNEKLYLDYLTYDPTLDECKLLPVCMGGCPKSRLSNDSNRCSEYRFILEEQLKEMANYILSNREETIKNNTVSTS